MKPFAVAGVCILGNNRGPPISDETGSKLAISGAAFETAPIAPTGFRGEHHHRKPTFAAIEKASPWCRWVVEGRRNSRVDIMANRVNYIGEGLQGHFRHPDSLLETNSTSEVRAARYGIRLAKSLLSEYRESGMFVSWDLFRVFRIVLLVAFVHQLSACSCGCLEHHAWFHLLEESWFSAPHDPKAQTAGRDTPFHGGRIRVEKHHHCDGADDLICFLDQRLKQLPVGAPLGVFIAPVGPCIGPGQDAGSTWLSAQRMPMGGLAPGVRAHLQVFLL